ncbi:hypothetical protein HGRIS_004505 [Hohenbuehelia grisea]|uniref:PH domain-containing protein n=1 Tax=Hohenbuehelia grisea TaxID=104357 RepID=A0ABR3JC43_9AGAR
MSPSAAPPSPLEIQRKLSVHSVTRITKNKPSNVSLAPVSGTESDSDSVVTPDLLSPTHPASHNNAYSPHAGASNQPPLSSIAERRTESGEDTEDEEDDDDDDGWKPVMSSAAHAQANVDDTVIKAGYLSKKGERRKTWKKRWFVLRPAHLAYYKTSAEYQLLRLLELSDVHSCTPVTLKRHTNTFGLISPTRTFYLQAKSANEVNEWVAAIEEARYTLMATSTQTSLNLSLPTPATPSSPIAIPQPGPSRSPGFGAALAVTPSPPSHFHQAMTSSDSEDASPTIQRVASTSSQQQQVGALNTSPSSSRVAQAPVDPGKTILAGYLMKCGSKRRNWRKRWFVLTGEKLMYSGSHMDTKPHRQFSFVQILDALEYDLPAHRHKDKESSSHSTGPTPATPPAFSSVPAGAAGAEGAGGDAERPHTFKIVTTKRALLLCAPSEEDEIRWLGAVRALIARRSTAHSAPGDQQYMQPPASPTTAYAGEAGLGGGLKAKVRRLSASGSAPMGGAIPEESKEERVR